MATMNPFDLLGDNDNDDPSQLIELATSQFQFHKVSEIVPNKTQQLKSSKLPTKPLPPSQAVREARNEIGREGGRVVGHGGGRGRGGYNRDYSSKENGFNHSELPRPQGDEGEGGRVTERRSYGGPRGPYRGGRRGGFNNEEGRDGDHPRRTYERHSGTGRGNEFKREGSGRGNWGSQVDEVTPVTEEVVEETEKDVTADYLPAGEEAVDDNKEPKEAKPDETAEKEAEEKEMTLEEYEKVLEEKRKALLALKTEERKVEVDKDLQSMLQLSNRKDEESIFIKLGSDKEKKKEVSERRKQRSINEFLKPADGEPYYSPGGRGRGRGRGPRGGGGNDNGYGGVNRMRNTLAPLIEDQKQFPILGGRA